MRELRSRLLMSAFSMQFRLIVLLLVLIAYVFTLDGAAQGLNAYLNPDISRVEIAGYPG